MAQHHGYRARGSQSHFNDLCELLGVQKPLDADPNGEWFAFERGATKATGGQGWADVWKRDCFGWEYKGKHGNLDKAYDQLLQYQGKLGNPPLLIVCDINTIIIHRHFTNFVDEPVKLSLDDLLDPQKLDLLRKAFTDPEALRPGRTTEHVTQEAARRFGEMAERLRKYGHEPQAVAHFLIRLLFCLFAEDVGILPAGLFTRLVTSPKQNAKQLQEQLRQLFAAMASGGTFGVDSISHVNGGLFNDDEALLLDGDSLRTLSEVSRQDWGAIEPAIFGTLFERGLDPGKRSQQGAHFTSKDDILLIVEPVLMAPLRRRWAEVKGEADALVAKVAELDAAIVAAQGGSEAHQPARQADRGAEQAAGPADRLPPGAGRGAGARPGVRERQLPLREPAAAARPGEGSDRARRVDGRLVLHADGRAGAAARHRDQPVRASWPRRRSGSATSSGGAITVSASPPSRS